MRLFGVIVSLTVFAVSGLVSSEGLAATNTSKFLNKTTSPPGKKNVWVTRRHVNDGNYSGDIAVVLEVVDDNVRGDSELEGVVYLYDRVVGGKYKLRKKYVVQGTPKGGSGGSVGENSRRRETCLFTDAAINPQINLRATLFKGKDHGNAAHRRVVLRYKEFAKAEPIPAKANGCDQADPADAAPVAAGDCCDLEPNEDVLEEEMIDYDPATTEPILMP